MATADEREQLRRLTTTATTDTVDPATGATTTAPRLTDAEADRLLAAYRCPAPREQLGASDTADVYGAASAWWEERALEAEAAALEPGEATAGGAVKSASVGDVTVTYTEGGAAAGASASQLWAVARRLARRSCRRGLGGAYTAELQSGMSRPARAEGEAPQTWDTSLLDPRPVVLGTDPVVNG